MLNHAVLVPSLSLLLCGFVGVVTTDSSSFQQDIDYSDRFRVFTGDGEPASFSDIVDAMAEVEVVLVGESHTDPVGHWLEAELLSVALERFADSRAVALSFEMFESDVQHVVDEYLQDLITESHFKASSRPWFSLGTVRAWRTSAHTTSARAPRPEPSR